MTPTAGLEPSYAAIFLVALLVGLCFPLYFSMKKHIRRSTVPSEAEYRAADEADKQAEDGEIAEGEKPSSGHDRSARRGPSTSGP